MTKEELKKLADDLVSASSMFRECATLFEELVDLAQRLNNAMLGAQYYSELLWTMSNQILNKLEENSGEESGTV